MKKNDTLLIMVVLTAALIWWGAGWWRAQTEAGGQVLIWQDKVLVGTYALDTPQPLELPLESSYGHNRVVIENGGVRMTEADCPDQVCVHSGEIREPGRTIVCLPNRVVVEIGGQEEGELDGLSQ